jgi:hypothetical protein
VPRRRKRKPRRRSRDTYVETITNRYLRSPYDPDNTRNFWGYSVSKTIGSPPRSGPGRWFAWLICASFLIMAGAMIAFGGLRDGLALAMVIVSGIIGVVLLLRLLGSRAR